MTVQTLTLVHYRASQVNPEPRSLTPTIPTAMICDNSLLRSGLQHILRGTAFVVAETASAAHPERLQAVATEPALVLIDASQGTFRVLETVRQVRERSPKARIVALANRFDPGFVRQGHEAGADGFCSVANGPAVLITSLELVMLGERVLSSEVLRSIMDATPQKREQPLQENTAEPALPDLKACKLSPREAEILGCLKEGAPNKLIARKLDITEATIKVHVKAILRKIGAANRTQAAMWANQRLPQQGRASVNG